MLKGAFTDQVRARRTFAIISHPDAGKTTLTEQLLLASGAIQLAGVVKGRKSLRHATSDWLAIEQARGISVSSSVMQIEHGGCVLNLLDTPGHEDFSEDTYRTLTAVDSVLMVIDVAKGVEERTRKLMEVCRPRKVPVITFINKLDRHGIGPIELLDGIEAELGLACTPMTWPIGMGREFSGLYEIESAKVHLFGEKGQSETIGGLDDPELARRVNPAILDTVGEQVELVRDAGFPWDEESYRLGELSPVYFGSALHHRGVREMLDGFVRMAPAPLPHQTEERSVDPYESAFTGFVFKIQANMDPGHRDRIAFVRICSGQYQPGMRMRHVRLNRDMKINNALTFMAASRERVDHAVSGDIIGLPNHGNMVIGDTLTEGERLFFTGIPNFAPELFRRVIPSDPMRTKAMHKGLQQLSEEGALQWFRKLVGSDLILGAVGPLQFEVAAHRLESEYGAACKFEGYAVATARWIGCDDAKELERFEQRMAEYLAMDHAGSLVYLAPNKVHLALSEERWPEVHFSATREYRHA